MSSSRILRGEQATAASAMPWSMSPVPRGSLAGQQGRPPVAAPAEHTPDENALAELRAQVDRARQAGYAEGQTAAQQRLKQQVDAATEQLGRAVAELAGYRDRLRRHAERDVVMLAVEIARRLIRRELSVDSDALAGLVRAALDKVNAREVYRVRTYTEHASCIKVTLEKIGAPQRIEVVPDSSLEPGSIVFETSRGEFDSSVSGQLAEIERGFVDMLDSGDAK